MIFIINTLEGEEVLDNRLKAILRLIDYDLEDMPASLFAKKSRNQAWVMDNRTLNSLKVKKIWKTDQSYSQYSAHNYSI